MDLDSPPDDEARLLAYLDDKLQTEMDMTTANLAELSSVVRENEGALVSQLKGAGEGEESAAAAVAKQEAIVADLIDRFEEKQRRMDGVAVAAMEDEEVKAVAEEWRPVMGRIGVLDVAGAYVKLMAEVDRLA